MKTLIFGILSIIASKGVLLATAQSGDQLDYKGKRVEIFTTPLEDYFSEDRKRPDFRKCSEFSVESSSCWRGYVGLWKINNGKLFLVSLHREGDGISSPLGKSLPLSFVFPNAKSPIFADWFTGVIRYSEGNYTRNTGFLNWEAGFFERDGYITVKNGKVVTAKVVDNTKKDSNLSSTDFEWVLLSEKPLVDKCVWEDARILFTNPVTLEKMSSGIAIVTRGIFFDDKDGTGALWVSATPKTDIVRFRLTGIPKAVGITNTEHVEIIVVYDQEEGTFSVKKVRKLKPGESMHHPKFQLSNKTQ